MVKSKKYTFSSLFSSSYNDYKQNYKQFIPFIFVTVGIISLISLIWEFYFVTTNESVKLILENPGLIAQGTTPPLVYGGGLIIFATVSILLTIFMQAGLIKTAVSEKKFSYKRMMANAKKYFAKYLPFFVIFTLSMIMLFFALIIPAIIFGVFWIFASFIFLDQKEKKDKSNGIIDSFKKSFEMVRGNWWKTFGYLVLLALAYIAFNLILGLIFSVFTTSLNATASTSNSILGLKYLLSYLNQLISAIITIPFPIIFIRNFYNARKEERKIK